MRQINKSAPPNQSETDLQSSISSSNTMKSSSNCGNTPDADEAIQKSYRILMKSTLNINNKVKDSSKIHNKFDLINNGNNDDNNNNNDDDSSSKTKQNNNFLPHIRLQKSSNPSTEDVKLTKGFVKNRIDVFNKGKFSLFF